MKKHILTLSLLTGCSFLSFGQSAVDAFRLNQPDMKGTARFMGMAGAFGALGGDLSSLSQNPAGIGVYRTGDIGFTLDLDIQSSHSEAQGASYDMSQTKFLLNNIGIVWSKVFSNSAFQSFNLGFTYNKGASFNRKYGGTIPHLRTSMSNYIAGIANADDITEGELATTNSYNPYNPPSGEYAPPWLPILGYDSYLITPSVSGDDTRWFGQWGDGTSGSASYLVEESGCLNEYNIALGGNIANILYWGMNFDIVNLNYTMNAIWEESLANAFVPDAYNQMTVSDSRWQMNNLYSVSGTGFNYQLGIIVKPVQEVRLGFAFHTPTWYNLTENFGANINYRYPDIRPGTAYTNDGLLGYNDMNLRTPWKIIASIAGVIGEKLILSFDYEWQAYNKMKFSSADNYGIGPDWDYGWGDNWDPGWGWDYMSSKSSGYSPATKSIPGYDTYYDTNNDIARYYQSSNTFRIGAEFRINSAFSLRAGYSNVSSPVRQTVKNNSEIIYTAGTLPNYRLDNSTNYIACGAGYRYKYFYIDLAYVYKHMSSTYHAFTPDPASSVESPQSKLSFNNSQVVLSAGFRF